MTHPDPFIALLQSMFVLLICVAALMGMMNGLRGRSFWGGFAGTLGWAFTLVRNIAAFFLELLLNAVKSKKKKR